MTTKDAAISKIRAWREYPAQFVYDNFHVEPDKWQIEVLNNLGGPAQKRRVCMKACTGPGKSALLAWAGWQRLACYAAPGEHPKGAALSITKDNLKDNLWSELSKWQQRSPFLTQAFTWTKEQIYANDHPQTWFLSARSFAKDADTEAIGRTLSGLHSQFPFILLDETGDMPIAVGRAAEQIFTGSPVDAAIIAAGNPTSTTGLLYHICQTLRQNWTVTTITADPDDPDRTPRVDKQLAQDQIDAYGRDNPWIMATILGLFPPAGFNSLLGLDDVERAMNRHYRKDQYDFAAYILGVDVAREGDDQSVIFPRQGIVSFHPKTYRNADSQFLAGEVIRISREHDADGEIIDGTGGYGAGVIDAMRILGHSPLDCQFASKPNNPKFANKRAEIWFAMADWIKAGGALPNIPALVQELTAPTYSFKGDKLLIEPKEQIKKRIGKSPDLADALACTFAFPITKQNKLMASIPIIPHGTTVNDYDPFGAL